MVYGTFARYNNIYKITVEREKSDKPFAPTGEITAVNGGSRTVSLKTESLNCDIYYTTDGETTPTTASTKYTDGVVISATTTIKAIAVNNGNVSDTYSASFEAGTTVAVNAPTYSITGMLSNGTAYNPTYTFTTDNSSVLCKPTSTLSATFDGSAVEGFTGSYTFTKPGKLVVTASAAGYDSNTAEVEISNVDYAITKSYDLIGGTDIALDNWTKQENQTTEKHWKFKEAENYGLNTGCEALGIDGITLAASNDTYKWEYFVNYGVRSNQTSKNNVPVKLTDGNDKQIVGWTASTSDYTITNLTTTFLSGTETFYLYRYSRMLTAVDVYAPAQTATISAGGYTTFCPISFNVSVPEGVTAYTAKLVDNDTKVQLSKVEDGLLKKECGYILKGTAGETYAMPYTATEVSTPTNNDLYGTEKDEPGINNAYVLGYGQTDGGEYYCFFGPWDNRYVLPAGKAYLEIFNTQAAQLEIVIDDEASAIAGVAAKAAKAQGRAYNLAGQTVSDSFRGIVVKDGKKVIK